MSGPFTVDTLGGSYGLEFSPQRRIAFLGDGSILTADATAATVTTLNRLTNPAGASPTVTVVTTITYGGGATTALVADLLVVNGTAADDIWVVLCSDAGAGGTVEVQHGTFTYATAAFAWDTKTTAVTAGTLNSQTASISWSPSVGNGAGGKGALIVVYREGSWRVNMVWTAVKAGTSGWSAAINLGALQTGSHTNPMLRYASNLLGNVAGGTAALYTNDTLAGHQDNLAIRVLPDSAASPALANWKAEVNTSGTIFNQNTGTAQFDAAISPVTGKILWVFNSSVVGTGGAIGTSGIPITVDSAGVATFGTRTTIDTTASVDVNVAIDARDRAYLVLANGAIAANSVINLYKSDAPWTSWGSLIATDFATATNGDNRPHVPKQPILGGYLPLFVQDGKTVFLSQFDNSITTLTAGPPLVAARTPPRRSALARRGDSVLPMPAGQAAAPPDATPAFQDFRNALRSFRWTRRGRYSLPGWGQATVIAPTAIPQPSRHDRRLARPPRGQFRLWRLAVQLALQFYEYTEQGISNAPAGHNSPQDARAYRWIDRNANGHDWIVIPGYGGALISRRNEIAAGAIVNGISQTSLTTTNPDGFLHLLANVGGVFSGTEDPALTLVEIAPTGFATHAYFDSGNLTPATGPALTYRVRSMFFPGDPGFIATRIDITNPSAAPVTLAGADGMEIAMLAGLTTVNQGAAATNAWPGTQGLYATVGGTETAWPGDTVPGPATANPDYVYITPVTNTGLSEGLFCIKQTGLVEAGIGTTAKISYLGPPDAASSRVKVKVQVTASSFPALTTQSLCFLQGTKRNIAAGDINHIAADYLNPDTSGILQVGTTGAPFFDPYTRRYQINAVGNAVQLLHTLGTPASLTGRYNPAYVISNWTTTQLPVITLNGVTLQYDVDYEAQIDIANQVLYVTLLKTITAANNGALVISLSGSALQAFVNFIINQTRRPLALTLRRSRRTSQPVIPQAAPTNPDLVSVLTRRQARQLSRWMGRRPSVVLGTQAAPITTPTARRRFSRISRGRSSAPVLPQAAPNPWQVVSTWVVRGRSRWTWRRARMHAEPALMPQQAAAPNPDITSVVQALRNSVRPWRVSRRGRVITPVLPQAAPNPWQQPATWSGRLRRATSWTSRRARQASPNALADRLPSSARRRPAMNWSWRARRLVPFALAAVSPELTGRRRSWRSAWQRLRRGVTVIFPFVPPPPPPPVTRGSVATVDSLVNAVVAADTQLNAVTSADTAAQVQASDSLASSVADTDMPSGNVSTGDSL